MAGEVYTKLNQLPVRWLMLTLQCIALIGSYYCYDNPAALETPLRNYFGVGNTNVPCNETTPKAATEFNTKFNLLYTVYSVPNCVLPFFGGYFCDKLGIRMMALVFTALITLGQFVFALGLTLNNVNARWWVMWTGRVVFGFGGESLSVAQSAMIAKWFVGKELALALGMNLALARVGSVVNDVVSIKVANAYKVYDALWVGFLVCVLSLLATVWCFFVDRTSEKRIKDNVAAQGRALGSKAFEPEPEEIDLKAVFRFPLIFWILTGSCLTVYCTVLPFNNIASGFITSKWLAPGVPTNELSDSVTSKANTIMMITYLTAGLLSPIMGGIIDRIGYRGLLNVVAALLIVGVHLTFRFSDLYPVVPLLVLGLCYSIYAAALWPSIALVVAKEHTATAYGVVTAIQNLGLAISPIVIGQLQPPSPSACQTLPKSAYRCDMTYNCVENFFISLGAVGCLFGLWLNCEDRRRPYPVLNLSEAAITKLVEKAGDITTANKKGGKGMDASPAMQGLLEGQSTPTLYETTGGPIVVEEGRPHPSRRRSVNGGSYDEGAGRTRSASYDPLLQH